MVLGGFVGRAFAKAQDASLQDKQDKKEEKKDDKKDEKKDEKKDLSLKPDHKIEFTTDEGTWISLDVSPDGNWLIVANPDNGTVTGSPTKVIG